MKNLRRELQDKGFCVIKNFFSNEEIEIMKDEISSTTFASGKAVNLGIMLPNAYQQLSKTRGVLENNNKISRLELHDEMYFTRIFQSHINAISSWHTDAGEAWGGYASDKNSDEYQVYKLIFFLNATTDKNCFVVREGTHIDPENKRKEVMLKTQPGDAIVFDTRIEHRGELPNIVFKGIYYLSKLMNFKKNISNDNALIVGLCKFFRLLANQEDRISLQWVFGKNNEITRTYEIRAKEIENKIFVN